MFSSLKTLQCMPAQFRHLCVRLFSRKDLVADTTDGCLAWESYSCTLAVPSRIILSESQVCSVLLLMLCAFHFFNLLNFKTERAGHETGRWGGCWPGDSPPVSQGGAFSYCTYSSLPFFIQPCRLSRMDAPSAPLENLYV